MLNIALWKYIIDDNCDQDVKRAGSDILKRAP